MTPQTIYTNYVLKMFSFFRHKCRQSEAVVVRSWEMDTTETDVSG